MTHTHSPSWSRLADAAAFALEIHADQVRKGTQVPYASHLLSVTGLALEYGADEEVTIAALLHDAVEDTPIKLAEIAARFGARVAGIVHDCSDTDQTPKPPWRARKLAYLAHLEHVGPDALLVSACDKLHNCRSICTDLRTHGLAVFSRFNAGQDGTMWIYAALSEVFTRRMPGPLAVELAEAVRTMEKLAAKTP